MEKLLENKYPHSVSHNEILKQSGNFRKFITWKGRGSFISKHLGSDISFLREWIQDKFIGNMSWDNYGKLWVIDHIVPFRMFDIFKESDLKICWNYRNLMPIFKHDNTKKQGNVFFAFELLHELKDKDLIYKRLFEIILPEVEWMIKYINNYHENRIGK